MHIDLSQSGKAGLIAMLFVSGIGLTGLPDAASAATIFTTTITASQEVAPAGATASPAMGTGSLVLGNLTPTAMQFNFALIFDSVLDFGPIASGLTPGEIGAMFPGSERVVTMMHIHRGARGETGPVVYNPFDPATNLNDDVTVTMGLDGTTTITGSWGVGDGLEPIWTVALMDLLPAMTGEDVPFYFNIHTVADPAGAIRGQIVAANDIGAEAIAPVPLPAAAPMLLSALAGLVWLRRRRGQMPG